MNLIANCGKRIILIAWIVFIIFTFIFSFSYLLFAILILLHLFYKRVEREILDDDSNIIVSPIDADVVDIRVDEEQKIISLVLKKTYFSVLFKSSELRSVIKSEDIKLNSINGIKYNDDFYCNCKEITYNNNIICVVKPAEFSVFCLDTLHKVRKGQRIGFLSSGIIEIKLPYNLSLIHI